MKYLKIIIISVLALTLLMAPIALAQDDQPTHEGGGSFKKIWNTVWKYINFLILVFIIVKYGRKPLMDFLRKRSTDIGDRIAQQQSLLNEAQKEYQEAEEKLSHIEQLIKEIEEYVKSDALRTKEDLLTSAEETAKAILLEAEERARHTLHSAQAELKKELVELAISEAEKILRQHMSAEDQSRLIGNYVNNIASVAA